MVTLALLLTYLSIFILSGLFFVLLYFDIVAIEGFHFIVFLLYIYIIMLILVQFYLISIINYSKRIGRKDPRLGWFSLIHIIFGDKLTGIVLLFLSDDSFSCCYINDKYEKGEQKLCNSCGKYYDIDENYCPFCGEQNN